MSRLLLGAVALALLVALFDAVGAAAQSDAAEVRIVARKALDGRVEFCLQVETTAARSCPGARFFPFEAATVGSWLRSRTIELGQATLHIRARRNPNRRIEFAIGVELDDESSVIQPELRFLNWDVARVGRWARSSPVLVRVTIPLPAGGIDEDAPRLAPGERAPNFALPRLGGEGVLALSDFRGRTVAIAFWASWGSGDAELLRALDQVWREQGANDGEFAALAVNTYDTWVGGDAGLRRHRRWIRQRDRRRSGRRQALPRRRAARAIPDRRRGHLPRTADRRGRCEHDRSRDRPHKRTVALTCLSSPPHDLLPQRRTATEPDDD